MSMRWPQRGQGTGTVRALAPRSPCRMGGGADREADTGDGVPESGSGRPRTVRFSTWAGTRAGGGISSRWPHLGQATFSPTLRSLVFKTDLQAGHWKRTDIGGVLRGANDPALVSKPPERGGGTADRRGGSAGPYGLAGCAPAAPAGRRFLRRGPLRGWFHPTYSFSLRSPTFQM